MDSTQLYDHAQNSRDDGECLINTNSDPNAKNYGSTTTSTSATSPTAQSTSTSVSPSDHQVVVQKEDLKDKPYVGFSLKKVWMYLMISRVSYATAFAAFDPLATRYFSEHCSTNVNNVSGTEVACDNIVVANINSLVANCVQHQTAADLAIDVGVVTGLT